MPFERGHALVIGVGTYANTPRMNVEQTAHDAERVAEILRDAALCGYPAAQVYQLIGKDATRAKILAALEMLAKRATADSTVFLFYAGHGEYGADASYYLTTHDTRMDVANHVVNGTGIAEKELLKLLKRIPARRALLIFNACYSGEISPAMLSGQQAEPPAVGSSIPEDLTTALLGTGEGRVIITACREGQKSYFLPSAQRTIFADALAAALEGKNIAPRNGYISVFDLYENIYTSVSTLAKEKWQVEQEPELTISKGVGAMAIALHQGTARHGALDNGDSPATLGAVGSVRALDPMAGLQLLEKIMSGEIKLGGDRIVNTSGGANLEGGSHKGIVGGTSHGPTIGVVESGATVDMSTTQAGDTITVGDITGSTGIAIGRNARATVITDTQQSEVDREFAHIYTLIKRRAPDESVEKGEIEAEVKKIQEESVKSAANEARLERLMLSLKAMAPDIFEVVATTLVSPIGGLSAIAKKVAARARQNR